MRSRTRANFFSNHLKGARELLTSIKRDGHKEYCGSEVSNWLLLLLPAHKSALKCELIYEARDRLLSVSVGLDKADQDVHRKLDVVLSLLYLLYEHHQYFSKRLFVETIHLKLVQKLLSLGLNQMAYEHVCYILDGFGQVSTARPLATEPNLGVPESQEFPSYRSLVVSCWLCLLLAVSELENDSGILLSSITVISSYVKSIQLWIDADIVPEKHLCLVFRYVLRIVERCVKQRHTAHIIDTNITVLAQIAFSACSRSSSREQLPYLVRRLAQSLDLPEFTESFAHARLSVIRSIETEKWLVELEQIAIRASKHGMRSNDVRIMYLISEAVSIDLEAVGFAQIIFLRLSLTGLCIPDDGELLMKHILASRKTFELVLSHGCDVLDIPRVLRSLDHFSASCVEYLQEAVLHAESLHSPYLIGLLIDNVALFVDSVFNIICVTEDNASGSSFRKCVLNLSLAQVMLLRAYFTFECDELPYDKENTVIDMFSQAAKVLESDDSKKLKKFLKQTTGQLLKKTFTKSGLFITRVYCTFCSVAAHDTYDNSELDEISECLITFTDACIAQGIPNMAFQTSVTELLRVREKPQLRYLYNFELVRCLCKVPESFVKSICLEAFERARDCDLSLSTFQDLLTEHLSIWYEVVRLKASQSADLAIIESQLACTLYTALHIVQTHKIVFDKNMDEILECLLLLLRRQSMRQQCDCLRAPLLRRLLSAIEENLSANGVELHLTAKFIEIKARVILLLIAQVTDKSENIDLTLSIQDLSKQTNDAYEKFKQYAFESNRDESFAHVRESWINIVIALDSIFYKLNFFDEFDQAACISYSIHNITGMRLEAQSCASNIITFPITKLDEQLVKQTSTTDWHIQLSDFEVNARSKITEVRVYITNGDLSSAFDCIKHVMTLVERMVKSHNLPSMHTDDMEAFTDGMSAALPEFQNTICFKGLNVSFATGLWQIIGLYLEIRTYHAIILYWLGIHKPSNDAFSEALRVCECMDLPHLSAAINIRRAQHLMERSLVDDAKRVMCSIQKLARKVCLRATPTQFLNDALDISLLALHCSMHHSCGDAIGGKIAHDTLVLRTMQMIKSCDAENLANGMSGFIWRDWCYFMLSRSALGFSVYMDIKLAELFLTKSRDWMNLAISNSTIDSAYLLLAESTLNIRRLRQMLHLEDCCTCTLQSIHDETIEMLVSALELWDSSSFFVKKTAILYGSLISSTNYANVEGGVNAAHVACGTSFRQRAVMNISETATVHADSGEKKHINRDDDANVDSTAFDSLSASLRTKIRDPKVQSCAFPVITLSESCFSKIFHCHGQGGKTLMLTRCSCLANETPIIVELPWPQVKNDDSIHVDMFEHLKDILNHSRDCARSENFTRVQKVAWWEERLLRDHQVHEVIMSLQRDVLGPFIFLLFGEPDVHEMKEAATISAQILRELQHLSERLDTKLHKFAPHLLRLMVQYIGELCEEQISSILRHLFIVSELKLQATGLSSLKQLDSEIRTLAEQYTSLRFDGESSKPRNNTTEYSTYYEPIYLLLDEEVAQLPWEAMPKLVHQQLFRIPCVTYSYVHVMNQENRRHSISCFDLAKTSILLNPSGDLVSTEKELTRFLAKNEEWKSITGNHLQHDLTSMLSTSDLFLYFGHGSGKQYVFKSIAPNSVLNAVMVLMGCSSGAVVRSEGDLEPDGDILAYLLSGVPSILANLWDVTDKDIDRFSVNLLDMWIDSCSKGETYSFSSASRARDSCRLRWLTGAAPVFFGSPVLLKDSRNCRPVINNARNRT